VGENVEKVAEAVVEAEAVLKGMKIEKVEERAIASAFLGDIQRQLKVNKVRYNLAIAVADDRQKKEVLDATVILKKQEKAVEGLIAEMDK
jgi:hypothetical protein